MKLNLSLKDRFVVPEVLPQNGNIQDLLAIRDIIEKVRIPKDTLEKYEEKEHAGVYVFPPEGEDIEFTASEYYVLQESCKRLNDNKQVTNRTLDLCMKVLGYNV